MPLSEGQRFGPETACEMLGEQDNLTRLPMFIPVVDMRHSRQDPQGEGRSVEFWASSETHGSAADSSEAVRCIVEPLLNRLLGGSRLADMQLTFRYVPIVMPAHMLDRYPSRSKARPKQRIVECAPQLDHDCFVDRSFKEQVDEHLRGVRTGTILLPKFGLSAADIAAFEAVLIQVGKMALN